MKDLRTIPIIRPIKKIVRFLFIRIQTFSSDRRTVLGLSNLPSLDGNKIIRVLEEFKKPLPSSEADLAKRIEAERKCLLAQNVPLVDGSLGDGGIYDQGVTISSACKVSKPPRQCLLMYKLVRTFQPKMIIELGTNVGISSAFQATALLANGQGGHLVTLETSPYRLKLARELHQAVGLSNISYVQGLFSDTLNQTLTDFGPVDFAFIDGHHQYQPTLDYFYTVWEHADTSALFVFDDIRWSEGMKQAWLEIQQDKRLGIAVDLNSMGICIGSEDLGTRPYATSPIISPLEKIF